MSRKATTLQIPSSARRAGHMTEVWQVVREILGKTLQFEICCAPGGFAAAYRALGASLGHNFDLVTDLGHPGNPGSQVMIRELVASYRDCTLN